MLDALFLSVLNMSITASLVIFVVLLVRLFLKKAPKIFSYALWAVVLFRLICPFSFESAIGLLPINKTPIPQDIVYSTEPQINTGLNIVDNAVNPMLPIPNNIGESINPLQVWAFIGSVIWVIGITTMFIYSIIQFVRLKRKLIGATPLRNSIYLADHISSPFVMGFIKPKIYLPSNLSDTEQGFIIAHEKHHIKRLDHIARILGFIAFTIHWFNPLVWIAFVLSGKDMEMSCDEAVMKRTDTDIRAVYSQSLLRFATGKKFIAATPLAFGEGDTKDRVKNVMKYKKPLLWVSIIAIIAVICVAVGLMSNPKTESVPKEKNGVSIENLWKNRTEYVGSNSKVGGILSTLIYPEKVSYENFALHTNEPPFTITVNLKTDTETKNFYSESLNQAEFNKMAFIIFSLVGNVEQVDFSLNDGANPYDFTVYRSQADNILGENYFKKTETLDGLQEILTDIDNKVAVNYGEEQDVEGNSYTINSDIPNGDIQISISNTTE